MALHEPLSFQVFTFFFSVSVTVTKKSCLITPHHHISDTIKRLSFFFVVPLSSWQDWKETDDFQRQADSSCLNTQVSYVHVMLSLAHCRPGPCWPHWNFPSQTKGYAEFDLLLTHQSVSAEQGACIVGASRLKTVFRTLSAEQTVTAPLLTSQRLIWGLR